MQHKKRLKTQASCQLCVPKDIVCFQISFFPNLGNKCLLILYQPLKIKLTHIW